MPKQPAADQFSDEEMEQMKRHGAAQLGGTSDSYIDSPEFSEGVEKELNKLQAAREASASKMKAAQTGGGDQGLGPSAMDQAAVKQGQAVNKQADAMAAAKAAQAQQAQAPINAPAAPAGPAGTTTTFPAQQGAVGGGGNAPQPSPPPPAPGGPDEPPPDDQEPPDGQG